MIFLKVYYIFRLAKPAFFKKSFYVVVAVSHFIFFFFFMWHRLDHYWSNVYQTDHRFGCLLKHFVITEKVFWRSWMHTNYLVLELENTGPQGMWRGGRTNRRRMGTQIVLRFLHWKRKSVTQRSRNYLPKVLQTGPLSCFYRFAVSRWAG